MDNKSDVMDSVEIIATTEEFDVTYEGKSYRVKAYSNYEYAELEFDIQCVSKGDRITEKLREKIIKFVKENA